MKSSSAKAKGRGLQQTVRDILLANSEGLTSDDVRSTGMGQSGVDIQLSQAAKKQLPFAIECKNLAKVAVYKFYEQAQTNAGELEPIVVIKQNRSKPLVIVDAEWFFENWRNNEHQRSGGDT
jgi:hypothetical protein